jgi:hypothetical protein
MLDGPEINPCRRNNVSWLQEIKPVLEGKLSSALEAPMAIVEQRMEYTDALLKICAEAGCSKRIPSVGKYLVAAEWDVFDKEVVMLVRASEEDSIRSSRVQYVKRSCYMMQAFCKMHDCVIRLPDLFSAGPFLIYLCSSVKTTRRGRNRTRSRWWILNTIPPPKSNFEIGFPSIWLSGLSPLGFVQTPLGILLMSGGSLGGIPWGPPLPAPSPRP